ETVGTCRSSSASIRGRTELGRRDCLRPDRATGRDNSLNMRLIQDSVMKGLQKVKRGLAAPPTDLDPPANGVAGAHGGRPRARRKPGAGCRTTQRGKTGEGRGDFSPTSCRRAGTAAAEACQHAVVRSRPRPVSLRPAVGGIKLSDTSTPTRPG